MSQPDQHMQRFILPLVNTKTWYFYYHHWFWKK